MYKLYVKDGGGLTFLTSTSGTSFTHSPSASGTYTYVVKAVYSNSPNSLSSGTSTSATVTIAPKNLSVTLNGPNPMQLSVGDSYSDPGIVVMCDGSDVTGEATIETSQSYIDTSGPGNYTITYSVSYGGLTASAKRSIVVSE